MTRPTTSLQLFDPREGGLAFRVERSSDRARFATPQRCNYFTVLLVELGSGTFHADAAEGAFARPMLLFFNPYETFFLRSKGALETVVLQFHANFFCIETHHEAVGCNGVLFNNLYGERCLGLTAELAQEFEELIRQMERELEAGGLAHGEILVALLKLFLVKATRLKLARKELEAAGEIQARTRPPRILEALIELIEKEYKHWHAPSEYAAALHMTPKALGKLVKARFGRTLTELIRERLLKDAKWQLLHTFRSVKEIAWEAGFEDELYFSRLFKRATGFSPTAFREFETAIRAGRNLSI